MIRDVLRMGDPRLLEVSRPVEDFGSVGLAALLDDMNDTMAAMNGAGIAAPQIGVLKRVVIFGFDHNDRYPDAEAVPFTVLCNPVITPLSDEMEDGWEGCLSVPGMRGVVPRYTRIRYSGFDQHGSGESAAVHQAIAVAKKTCVKSIEQAKAAVVSIAIPTTILRCVPANTILLSSFLVSAL